MAREHIREKGFAHMTRMGLQHGPHSTLTDDAGSNRRKATNFERNSDTREKPSRADTAKSFRVLRWQGTIYATGSEKSPRTILVVRA